MITILGPTASGKTSVATALAADMGGEIISADSRQVYRGMDIGTGKDLADYVVDGKSVPYHLIDIDDAYSDITSRGVLPVLCGGTGLYIEAVLKGYSLSTVPQNQELRNRLEGKSLEELTALLIDLKKKNGSNMHNRSDVDSCQRAIRAIEIEEHNLHHPMPERELPPVPSLIIGLDIDRDERRAKITRRLRQRLDDGMVDEIRNILNKGVAPEDLIYYGLEYKFVTEYVIGKLSFDELFRQLEIAIHQFAKRQMTWFRGMERRGFTIHWIDAEWSMEQKISCIKQLMETQ